MNIKTLIALVIALAAPTAFAADIAGIWKHSDEPGWIEIQVNDGVAEGVLVRNDKFPERVGRTILKDLIADDSEDGLWTGQVYAERLGKYKNAKVSLPEPDALRIKVKVGFMRHTVDWLRVDQVPTEKVEAE